MRAEATYCSLGLAVAASDWCAWDNDGQAHGGGLMGIFPSSERSGLETALPVNTEDTYILYSLGPGG